MTDDTFTLADVHSNPILDRDGNPFRYSTYQLARAARGILEGHRKVAIRVISPTGTPCLGSTTTPRRRKRSST